METPPLIDADNSLASPIDLDTWLSAAMPAAEHVMSIAAHTDWDSPATAPEGPEIAAEVDLEGDNPLRIGISVDTNSANALARQMLDAPDHPPFEPDVLTDVVSELTNMVAGLVKLRLARHERRLRIALPRLVAPPRSEPGVRSIRARFGSANGTLWVGRTERAS